MRARARASERARERESKRERERERERHLQHSLGTVLIGGTPCFSLRRWQNLIKKTGDDLGVMYSTVVPEGSDRRSIEDTCVTARVCVSTGTRLHTRTSKHVLGGWVGG